MRTSVFGTEMSPAFGLSAPSGKVAIVWF